MNGSRILAWTVALAALAAPAAQADRFVAYSMKEAERRLAADPRGSQEAHELGGITHVAGMVYDRQGQDFILVGVARPGASPLSLDDLVVSLRCMLVHNTPPLVSIDPTPDTEKTRKQSVRFQGGIEQTALGKKMLEADLVLKRLALGRLRAEVWGVRSYFAMLLEEARRGELETRVRSRFWLTNHRPSLAIDKDVFAILEQDIAIQTEVLYAEVNGQAAATANGAHRDAAGERFSEQVARNFADLSLQHPALAQVRPILAMVSVAEGIRRLGSGAALGYWLGNYRPASVPTPREHELLEEEAEVEGKSQKLVVSGGIEINPIVVRLNAGDVTALRDAVLRSRPSANALTWEPPLAGWQIPGIENIEAGPAAASGADGGFSLDRTLRDTQRQIEQQRQTQGQFQRERQIDRIMSDTQRQAEQQRQLQQQFNISRTLPPQRFSPGVGGVMLQGAARPQGGQAAAVDLSRGHFALVVDGQNARLAPAAFRRFVTALWAVYYTSQDPGISIDPIGPGINKHLVRYIGRVVNTDLGRVMRECDYLMKKWAIGTERPDIDGFRDIDTLGARHGLAALGASRRFWFIPEQMTFRRADDALLFSDGHIRLRTEYLAQEAGGRAAPSDEKFAEFFTRNYDKIAARYPVFQELFEYAKLVSLARFLQQSGVPLYWFLMANKDLVLTEDSPGTVDALAKGSRYYEGLTIEGGVDLRTQYVLDESAARAMREALARLPAEALSPGTTALRSEPARASAEPFSFSLGKADYSVLPQHSLTSGKDRRGLRYQTDFALRRGGLPGLEAVRYFDPGRPEGGEFGQGWRLLVPYRVSPAGDATREFLNVRIPEKMAVENLLTGQREVLAFSTDRYSVAGYVPDQLATSQLIGLFLMSNASFRLADKLGNEFWFNPDGRLSDMVFARDHRVHIEYARGFTVAFAEPPYRVSPDGEEQAEFGGARVPARMRVADLRHGTTETLAWGSARGIMGYVPANPDQSRYEILALRSNRTYQLLDRAGNESLFDRHGRFESMALEGDPLVESIAQGESKVEFRYGLDQAGHARVATAALTQDGSKPAYAVRYHYDTEGRLAKVESDSTPQVQARAARWPSAGGE